MTLFYVASYMYLYEKNGVVHMIRRIVFPCIILDVDECFENPRICLNGACENTPGSYECVCLPGFTTSADGTFCIDTDECADTGMCSNGKCINVDGSFTCVCDSGFRLSPDRKRCIGK